MLRSSNPNLGDLIALYPDRADPQLIGANGIASVKSAAQGTCLDAVALQPDGRSILLLTPDQLTTALALIELDGVARRIVICPADVDASNFSAIVRDGEIDLIICGDDGRAFDEFAIDTVRARPQLRARARDFRTRRTEWVLLTSGTTGAPKLVLHDLASLIAPIEPPPTDAVPARWATFYDIRRYGGMQIFLRAMVGGAPLVLSHADERIAVHLQRLRDYGATHISGTPSHWRRVLMSGLASTIAPAYVRLSGEIANQAILDALQAAYPNAGLSHAYASTEAGVVFNVADGQEGFPARLVDDHSKDKSVDIKIEDDSLRIRSRCTASRYLGDGQPPILDADGFVDSGDLVALRGDRYCFVGRRGGVINVGGKKVFPEEIEQVINNHPAVQVSLVYPRKNPITGALVVADIVLAGKPDPVTGESGATESILEHCRSSLPAYKVPARIRIVPTIAMTASGKLVRQS